MDNQNYNEFENSLIELKNTVEVAFEKGQYKEALDYVNYFISENEKDSYAVSLPYFYRSILRILYSCYKNDFNRYDFPEAQYELNFSIFLSYLDFSQQNEETAFDFFWSNIESLALSLNFYSLSFLSDKDLISEECKEQIFEMADKFDMSRGYKLPTEQKLQIISDKDIWEDLIKVFDATPDFRNSYGGIMKIDTLALKSFFKDMFINSKLYIMENGKTYYLNGDIEKALFYYSLATEIDTDNKEYIENALSKKGICLYELNKYEEAKVVFEKAIKFNPANKLNKEYLDECIDKLR